MQTSGVGRSPTFRKVGELPPRKFTPKITFKSRFNATRMNSYNFTTLHMFSQYLQNQKICYVADLQGRRDRRGKVVICPPKKSRWVPFFPRASESWSFLTGNTLRCEKRARIFEKFEKVGSEALKARAFSASRWPALPATFSACSPEWLPLNQNRPRRP